MANVKQVKKVGKRRNTELSKKRSAFAKKKSDKGVRTTHARSRRPAKMRLVGGGAVSVPYGKGGR